MIKVVILYPNANGNWFNRDYYINRHVPLVRKYMEPYGMEKFEIDMGIAGMNGPAPYLAIGYLHFNSMDQFQQAMAAEGKTLTDDIPNYTRDFIVQIGQAVEIMETV